MHSSTNISNASRGHFQDGLSRLRRMITKTDPMERQETASDRIGAIAERLTSLSPHLIEDIGFTRDAMASTPTREVWRHGDVYLVISGGRRRVECVGALPGGG